MDNLEDLDVVVAGPGPDGKPAFIEAGTPFRTQLEGVVEAAWIWGTDEVVTVPAEIGSVPTGTQFPPAGGTRFALFCFAPHSAGKLDLSADPTMRVEDGDDPGMHRSDSIDYEFVLSGKVDVELPGGQKRTLRPGSCLVMGGVAHAWSNHYNEPCVYAAVIIGAR
jgi:Cupin domain